MEAIRQSLFMRGISFGVMLTSNQRHYNHYNDNGNHGTAGDLDTPAVRPRSARNIP